MEIMKLSTCLGNSFVKNSMWFIVIGDKLFILLFILRVLSLYVFSKNTNKPKNYGIINYFIRKYSNGSATGFSFSKILNFEHLSTNPKPSTDIVLGMLSSSKTETERHNYKFKWSSASRFWKFYKAAVLVHVCQCVNASKILANHVLKCEFAMISWTFMTTWLLTSQILETAGNCSFKHQKVLPHSKPLNPNCCGLHSVTKCTNT